MHGLHEGLFVGCGIHDQKFGRTARQQIDDFSPSHGTCAHHEAAGIGKAEKQRIVAHGQGIALSGTLVQRG